MLNMRVVNVLFIFGLLLFPQSFLSAMQEDGGKKRELDRAEQTDVPRKKQLRITSLSSDLSDFDLAGSLVLLGKVGRRTPPVTPRTPALAEASRAGVSSSTFMAAPEPVETPHNNDCFLRPINFDSPSAQETTVEEEPIVKVKMVGGDEFGIGKEMLKRLQSSALDSMASRKRRSPVALDGVQVTPENMRMLVWFAEWPTARWQDVFGLKSFGALVNAYNLAYGLNCRELAQRLEQEIIQRGPDDDFLSAWDGRQVVPLSAGCFLRDSMLDPAIKKLLERLHVHSDDVNELIGQFVHFSFEQALLVYRMLFYNSVQLCADDPREAIKNLYESLPERTKEIVTRIIRNEKWRSAEAEYPEIALFE